MFNHPLFITTQAMLTNEDVMLINGGAIFAGTSYNRQKNAYWLNQIYVISAELTLM